MCQMSRYKKCTLSAIALSIRRQRPSWRLAAAAPAVAGKSAEDDGLAKQAAALELS